MQAEVLFPPGAGLTGLRRRPSRAAQRAGTSQRPGTECRQPKIESLAQQRRWHDYRYTFKVYIPSQIATAAPCTKTPGVTLTSPGDIALNRMNFTVSCPQSWQMNVAVRPDVLVPVVMAKSLVARDTPLTANDVG